jgi:hypothetical protein
LRRKSLISDWMNWLLVRRKHSPGDRLSLPLMKIQTSPQWEV